jgi:glycerophosphoryl diester phosphodiesterase
MHTKNQKLKVPAPLPWPIPFFAHRGGTANPKNENTLAAFGNALDEGSPGIELDVHCIKGQIKVTHYQHIARRKGVPVLEEVLDFIDKKCNELKRERPVINIDIKGKGTGKRVAAIIKKKVTKKKWNYTDFIVTAFTRKNIKGAREAFHELKKLKNMNGKIATGIIGSRNTFKPYIKFINEVNACSLHTKWKKGKFTSGFVNDAHNQGLTVYPWNVNSHEQITDAFAKGADGVITDYIAVAKKVCLLK